MSCYKKTRVKKQKHTLPEGKMPENCEKTRKIVKEPGKKARNYANDFFFRSCVLIFHFSFKPCREKSYLTEQKHTLSNCQLDARLTSQKHSEKKFSF